MARLAWAGEKNGFFTTPLSAARVHLKMRILAQAINADQPAFAQSGALQGFAFFCAAVTTQFPAALNERPHLAGRNAITERFP